MPNEADFDKRISVLARRWDGETLDRIKDDFGVSRERIRQLETTGREHLRRLSEAIAADFLSWKKAFGIGDLSVFGEKTAKAIAYTLLESGRVSWLGFCERFVPKDMENEYRKVLLRITNEEVGFYSSLNGNRMIAQIRHAGLRSFVDLEAWKRFAEENGYVIAGQYVISPRAIVKYGNLKKAEMGIAVERFFHGRIRLPQRESESGYENYNELRLVLRTFFGADWVSDKDRQLFGLASRWLILCDISTFTTRNLVDINPGVLPKIADWVEEFPRNTIYYSEIFEANRDMLLKAGITNPYLLKGVFQDAYPERYNYSRAVLFKGPKRDDFGSMLFSYMKENDLNTIRVKDLRTVFPGVPECVFQNLYSDERFDHLRNGLFRLKENQEAFS